MPETPIRRRSESVRMVRKRRSQGEKRGPWTAELLKFVGRISSPNRLARRLRSAVKVRATRTVTLTRPSHIGIVPAASDAYNEVAALRDDRMLHLSEKPIVVIFIGMLLLACGRGSGADGTNDRPRHGWDAALTFAASQDDAYEEDAGSQTEAISLCSSHRQRESHGSRMIDGYLFEFFLQLGQSRWGLVQSKICFDTVSRQTLHCQWQI
jgi:hypothetical protein